MKRYKDPIQTFLIAPHMRLARHLGLWIFIIFISIGIVNSNIGSGAQIPGYKYFLLLFTYISVFAGTFYLTSYWAVKQFLVKNNLFHYILFIIGTVLVDNILVVNIIRMVLNKEEMTFAADVPPHIFFLFMLNSMLSVALIVAGLSTVFLLRYWIVSNERKTELEAATLHSELNNLKKQINPHFLFNMLNNAHVLIRKKRPEASRILFKLEDLLRYQIEDSSKEQVELNSDIQFLYDFLNLEKIRRDGFSFVLSKEGYLDTISVPPLLFIPFVENAVKYSQDSEHASYVLILFSVDNGELTFQCVNSRPEREIRKSATGGLGLKNICRRLELLYPGRHTLSIIEEKTIYMIKLTIKL